MNHFYEVELTQICNRLLLMGRRCAVLTRSAMKALSEGDRDAAQAVLAGDDQIDELEKEIDAECIRYITLRSPVASDVRLLTVAMKVCHDLERIGDEACSIARRVGDASTMRSLSDSAEYFANLSRFAVDQLDLALDAFANRNAEKAHRVTQQDRTIDDLHRQHVRILLERASSRSASIEETVAYIFISKSLERIGDHAKNFAEEVIFLLEGDDVRHTPAVKNTTQARHLPPNGR